MDIGSSAAQPLTPATTDLDLLTAIQAGQVDALRLLYRRYSSLVYTMALKILNNQEDAEELTQDIFLKLCSPNTYQPQRGSLSQFLVCMTRSRAIDRIRSRQSRQKTLQRWQTMMAPDPVSSPLLDHVSLAERSQQILQALDQLSAAERQVLEIAYYQGLSQAETAKYLNIPLGTVKSRARQALKKLHHIIQDRFLE